MAAAALNASVAMDAVDLGFYRHQGHLTVNGVFAPAEMDAVVADIEAWGESFLAALPEEQRAWYVDGGVQAKTVLRKLDNPHAHRPAVQQIARDPRLVSLVEQVLGRGVSVYFSQIFFKAPEGGGPKPAHQDNFYFGPSDPEGIVTAWIALDDATLENGCLYFGEGTNLGPVYAHIAPEAEPFNLQLPAGGARQAADGAGAGAKGRRELSPRQHVPPVRAEPQRALAPRVRAALRQERRRVRDAGAALRPLPQAAHHLKRPQRGRPLPLEGRGASGEGAILLPRGME